MISRECPPVHRAARSFLLPLVLIAAHSLVLGGLVWFGVIRI